MENPRISEQELEQQQHIADLKLQLQQKGIPLEQWGRGEAKTVAHLAKELQEGESVLVDKNGELVRQVTVAGITVLYEDETGKYKLVEDRQVFADGRQRKRTMKNSVSEKMKPDEDPHAAFRRGLLEELPEIAETLGEQWTQTLTFTNVRVEEDERVSGSFPGLKSRYTAHLGDIHFSNEQYRAEGYIEQQADKSTYFLWEKIEPEDSQIG